MNTIINDDTIIAPITSVVGGSVAVLRISGPDSINTADQFFTPHHLEKSASGTVLHGYIQDGGQRLDEVMLSVFRSPKSYTGENVIEISSHANPFIVESIIDLFIRQGCRYAEPGEFTRRAFINGKIDLAQAEAVQEIIAAQSRTAVKNAVRQLEGSLSDKIKLLKEHLLKIASLLELDLDFSEEGLEIITPDQIGEEIVNAIKEIGEYTESYKTGKNFSEPIEVVIAGKPNVGKSSLMNALLKKERVIVSEIPGTTRDYIHEEIMVNDVIVKFIDTAGIRITDDALEIQGVQKAKKLFSHARHILIMVDISQKMDDEDENIINKLSKEYKEKIIIVGNKTDLGPERDMSKYLSEIPFESVQISAQTQKNIDRLKSVIYEKIKKASQAENQEIYITSKRQYHKLIKTNQALEKIVKGLDIGLGYEFLAVDMRDALDQLSEIVGEITTNDILNNVFKNFCIGK